MDNSEKKKVDSLIEKLQTETSPQSLKQFLTKYHPADIAEALDDLSDEARQTVLKLLDVEQAGEVLDEAGEQEIKEFVEPAPVETLAKIVDTMPADEAADLLEHVDEEKAEEVVSKLEPEHALDVRKVRGYKSETAGGIMTTEFFWIKPDETAEQALNRLKSEYEEMETVNVIFVCNGNKRLQGIIDVADLIAAPPEKTARNIMEKALISVVPETDQEVCARLMKKYDFDVLSVVDASNSLLGIITVDDILEVMEEEASEDMYRLAGIGDDKPLEHGPFVKAFKRLPWLVVTLAGMSILGIIMSRFHLTIEKVIAVSFFIPAIMGLGGNVGIQSATLTVRGLATGEIDLNDFWWLLWRELLVAFIIGFVCAVVLGAVAYGIISMNLPSDSSPAIRFEFALVVAFALMCGTVGSALVGTSVPMICHRLNIDPAIASGPFVTTVIDIGTQSIYLGLATWILIM